MKSFHLIALLATTALASPLMARDDCKYAKAEAGDSCSTLAAKCGISADDFTKYNPDPKLCSQLAIGQLVCCSAGTLPNLSPKPNPDGTCAKYTTVNGDYCFKMAADHDITVAQLESFNQNTPNWSGCSNLYSGTEICVSTGPFSL
ncbi:hypothetical protein GQ53DRAFT_835991 [Thozetella sp. PMI_491]|nr:hypothetical protein GQ53DRAFT_835991 [Thozetella sp. PMI_491]